MEEEKMNKEELDFILKEGEGYKIEFKESLADIDKEIVSFANASGGRIFLGVDDEGKVKGVEVTNKLKSQIQDIANNCDPTIEIKISSFDNILIVDIPESLDKPHKCKGGFFMRVGPNSQKIDRDKILKLAIDEGKIKFDEQLNKKFDFQKDFNEERFRLFLKENNLFSELNTKDALVSLGLAKKEENELFMNNAGILFFAKDPQRFFLHAYLDCILFKGKDKSDVIDRKTFRIGLLDQLASARDFVKKHLNLSYEFKQFEREEKYEIPLRAIEEAIVNALMHRDYFFKGANVSLHIYGDRLEVISPGGLPKGLEKKDFGRFSVRRNQIIADIFSKTPYVEQTGAGIKRMRNLLREANLPLPKFEMNSFFVVTFKRKEPKGFVLGKSRLGEKLGEKLGENEEKILAFITENKHITTKELSEEIGISTTAVENNISKLKEKGILKRIGPDKGGYWEIIA